MALIAGIIGIPMLFEIGLVSTVTAAGIVTSLATGLSATRLALLVLAVGAGSLIFSHVYDAGFCLVKEYFGMTTGQTNKI